MELKKTTILSSFVCMAGILAQIMFHDILSKDVFGVIISIVLAVIILISFYFVFDGIECLLQQIKDRDVMHQKEYEKRLYNILSEQIKFQKATYSEVKDIQQTQEAKQMLEQMSEKEEGRTEPVEVKFPDNLVYEENMEQIRQEINDYTAQSAQQVCQEVNDYTAQSAQQIRQEVNDYTAQSAQQIRQEVNDYTAQSAQQIQQEVSESVTQTVWQFKEEMSSFNERLEGQVNDHTTMSAKIVAKYVGRTAEEIKAVLGEQDADVKKLLMQIEENQNKILELLKKKR